MIPLLVVSPHLDDAVLSAGQVLAGRPDCLVATLFTGTPPRTRQLTSYDKNCGFRNAREAMTARRREDRAAMHVLAARSVHLGLLDHQYRGDVLPEEERAAGWLAVQADETGAEEWLGPLGLAHPDHEAAARICADFAHRRPGMKGWLYEDLPSRVLYPAAVPAALAAWREWGFDAELGFVGTGDPAAKEAAIDCYASQLWALDRHVILCPERMWALTPCA